MTERIDVMISSTSKDLPEHRAQAKAAIEQAGGHALVMENMPASPEDAITESLKFVDEAEIYIGIFAHRYGYVPDSPRNPGKISITEMEYRRAVERKIPILIFIMDPAHNLTAEMVEKGDGAAKLEKLKDELKKTYVVAFFKSAEDLRGHVLHALSKMIKPAGKPFKPEPMPEPGVLPEPGDLPPGSSRSRMLGRNPNFTGREEDLIGLAGALLCGTNTVITPAAAAVGSGGIGKSQLAIEFAYRYGRCFYGVHWIDLYGVTNGDTLPRFEAEVAACGAEMGLAGFPETQPEQVRVTLATWAQSAPRLVILDNAETPQAVQDVLPRLAGARVLVTSRWNEAGDWQSLGIAARGLDTLKRAQSLELLRKLAPHLKDTPDAELGKLAEWLGDFPLALDLAGRYLHSMRRAGLTAVDYVKKLDAGGSPLEHASMREWAAQAKQISPTKHDTDVAATFRLSWDKVDDPLACELFRACGYLAPNRPIPPELLLKLADGNGEALALALGQLVNYGLLAPDPAGSEMLLIQPLLAAFARGLDGEAGTSMLPRLADKLAGVTKEAGEPELPAKFTPLRPHVEVAAEYAEQAEVEAAGALWNNLGYHLDMIADLAGAQDTYEQALRIDEAVFGPDHPSVARDVNNLGSILKELGDLEGARAAYQQGLRILEQALGPDHPNVAGLINNLGGVLYNLGDLEGTRLTFERALRIDEAVYGPEHPKVAMDVSNLGLVLQDLGDLHGARGMYERALRIDEAVYGPKHPSVARDVSNLGRVLQDLGNLHGAQEMYERALRINEAVYAPNHPIVVRDVNNLKVVQDKLDHKTEEKIHSSDELTQTEKRFDRKVTSQLSIQDEIDFEQIAINAVQEILKKGLQNIQAASLEEMNVKPIFGLPSRHKKFQCNVFMIMPFAEEFLPIYADHIVPTVEALNLSIKRGDNFFSTHSIMQNVWAAIAACQILIAECTGRNANVFYELGIAHTIGKPVIMITQQINDIPFDLRYLRVIEYQYTPPGMKKFEGTLKNAILDLLAEL